MGVDLQSIHQARTLVQQAKLAQKQLAQLTQQEIDRIVKAIADASYENREKLAKIASDETGFGVWQDKVIKNSFASVGVYESIKDMKTVGIINENRSDGIIEVAVPVGVIVGLIPSTNPTSTVINKALIAIKTANSIVFSPHPNALECILETTRIIVEAAEAAGCPPGALSCLSQPTLEGTNELMTHRDTSLILATGGSAMVRAAYSSGKPAIGVGPGNGPAFIDKSANLQEAVKRIIKSKSFDHSVICSSEQSIVVEDSISEEVKSELMRQGAHFLTSEEANQLKKTIFDSKSHTMKPKFVGKSVSFIAEKTNLAIPQSAKIIVVEESKVGKDVPFSREKLAPIIAFYVVNDWKDGLNLCVEILTNEGAGHTMTVHSENEEVIRAFGLKAPVHRLLVNTSAGIGSIGATTSLFPSLTLGCGAIGNGSTSDNVGPQHLFNIRRIAYGFKDMEDLDPTNIPQKEEVMNLDNEAIKNIVKQVMEQLEVTSK